MDKNITLYQITNVMAEKVFQKIDHFNKGRRKTQDIMRLAFLLPTVLIMLCGASFLIIAILLCLYALWLSLSMMLPNVHFVFAEL